jgi:predicted MFS family arabinose efflux permease
MLVPEAQLDRANGMMEISFNLAGIVAPALAGLVYSIGGLQAVIAIDLLTFLAAIIIVFFQHIPMPEQSEAGKAASGSLRTEMLGGLHYLWQRPLLWWTVVYIAFIFFLINGPLGMVIPYLSQITADESVLGLLMSTMSAGALAGSLLVMRGGENPRRMRLILLLYVLHGIMLMLYGITRDPLWMGVVLFVLMLPLPFAGALFSTILQTRTPPDLQGRVFAITGQMFTLTTPFSFLITAYLVDEVLEPAVQQPVWSTFAPLLGNQPGAGMGLILVTIGVVITLLSLLMLAIPAVRHLEAHLNG